MKLPLLLATARAHRALAAAIGVPAIFVAVQAARIQLPWARCGGAVTRIDNVSSCGGCGVTCGGDHATPSCVAGKCVLTCERGHADCDGHPGNGCEVDLDHDRFHCGMCERSCNGAACEDGVCAARLMGTGEAIAADDTAVYSIGASVMKYPLDGGDPVTLAPGARTAPAPGAPVADAAFTYWAEPAGAGAVVRRASRRGGEPVTVATHPFAILRLVANGTHLFWADEKQRIFMAPKLRPETKANPAGNRLP